MGVGPVAMPHYGSGASSSLLPHSHAEHTQPSPSPRPSLVLRKQKAIWKTQWTLAVPMAPKSPPDLRRCHEFSKLLWSIYCVRGTDDPAGYKIEPAPVLMEPPVYQGRLTLNQPMGGLSDPMKRAEGQERLY